MDDIFNSKPAKFPNNNTEEYNSVFKLLDILDKERIKPDPKLIDKFPNTDGEITIVDPEQYTIGKCEIQIKTLPIENLNSPKYQCSLPFLSYCSTSLHPVILIAVNAQSEKAYWMHFFRKDLIELSEKIKGKSIVADFPINNVVSRTDKEYINEWTKILSIYIQKKIDYDKLLEQKEKLEELTEMFVYFPKPVHSISQEDIKSISIFIDTINNALDNDFLTIKEILYYQYWKMSIVYNKFNDSSVSYALVPIKYGENDLLIKEIKSMSPIFNDRLAKVVSRYNTRNPIKDSPTKHAFEIIEKDTLEVIKNKYISLINVSICYEYIIDFLDKFDEVFPMIDYEQIDVRHILNIVQNYLPIWVEEYSKFNLNSLDQPHLYFDIGSMLWHTLQEEVDFTTQNAIKRYESNDFSLKEIIYAKKDYDVNQFVEYLNFLINQDIDSFVRPYAPKTYIEGAGFVWDWYTPAAAFKKMQFIFTELSKTYDQFIESFFPKLFDSLKYYNSFDLQIINLQYSTIFTTISDSPGVEIYYLKSKNTFLAPKIEFYLNSENCPVQWSDCFDKARRKSTTINGIEYEIVSGSNGEINYLFENNPLKENLHKILEDRFKEYFKIRTSLT